MRNRWPAKMQSASDIAQSTGGKLQSPLIALSFETVAD
jgi:hypothetical protein